MTMHLIVNTLGQGKTLFLTFCAIISHIKGREVFSNYKTAVTGRFVRDMGILEELRGGDLFVDDAYMWLDSRVRRDNKGRLLILAKSRKRDIDIFLSCVRPHQIDLNVRYNVAFIWIPQVIKGPSGLPIMLQAHRFEYRPEMEKAELEYGEYRGTITITGTLLRRIMYAYDTLEEIDELDSLTGG
jgi:hypothetical protein